MDLALKKEEKYLLLTLSEHNLNKSNCDIIEKEIVKSYRVDGNANYILELKELESISTDLSNLLKKINRVCENESGILVLVTAIDLAADFMELELENATILPTVEEAIEAVFMNEMENDFGFDLEQSDEYDD